MNTNKSSVAEENPLAILRRFARPRTAPEEKCELCSVPLVSAHRHLIEMSTQKLVCSCGACALLFENVSGGRFKLIPRDVYILGDFQITDAEWESLSLPINLVFFFHSTPKAKIAALYPSPAGPTESLLPLTNWQMLVKGNPVLREMQCDVQALLVNRVGTARDFFIAPIDVCYELVGLIRLHWRGFSGGDALWQEVGKFFARLKTNGKTRLNTCQEGAHA